MTIFDLVVDVVLLEEGKRPLGRSECRWENNISMDVNERVWAGFM
jgi:hypothetical protein